MVKFVSDFLEDVNERCRYPMNDPKGLDLIFDRVPISLKNFNFQIPQTRFTRQCNITAGQYPCLVKGCYTQADICNGRPDCEDGFDESNCYDFAEWQQEQTLKFRLSRYSGDLNNIPEKHTSLETINGSMSRTFCMPRSALCFWWIILDWTIF